MEIKTTRIYRMQLKGSELRAYDEMYEAWKNFVPTVTVRGVKQERLMEIVSFIILDNPLLFYVDYYYITYSYSLFSDVIKVNMKYLFSKNEARILLYEIEARTKAILNSLDISSKDPYEKVLCIHDWFAKNIDYSKSEAKNQKHHSLVGVLAEFKGVCDSYAKTFKLLCEMAGVTCVIVKGKSVEQEDNIMHAWNMVRVGDHCAHIDVTWDANLIEGCPELRKKFALHAYFMKDDDEMKHTHSWDRTIVPRCSVSDLNFYKRNNLIAYNDSQLLSTVRREAMKGRRAMEIKLMGSQFSWNDRLCSEAANTIAGALGKSVQLLSFYDDKNKIIILSY